MGLSVKKLLLEYFSKEQVQDALRDIGEITSGTKEDLVDVLTASWKSYNRDNYELLYFLDKTGLQMICYHYNLDASPTNEDTYIRRIKKANLLGSTSNTAPKKNAEPHKETKMFSRNEAGQLKVSRKGAILTIISTIVTIIGIVVTIFYSTK